MMVLNILLVNLYFRALVQTLRAEIANVIMETDAQLNCYGVGKLTSVHVLEVSEISLY